MSVLLFTSVNRGNKSCILYIHDLFLFYSMFILLELFSAYVSIFYSSSTYKLEGTAKNITVEADRITKKRVNNFSKEKQSSGQVDLLSCTRKEPSEPKQLIELLFNMNYYWVKYANNYGGCYDHGNFSFINGWNADTIQYNRVYAMKFIYWKHLLLH